MSTRNVEENSLLWRGVVDSFRKLYAGAQKNLVSKAGLSFAEYRILSILNEETCSMSTFSANLSMTQAAITGIVDKLETQGFVSRTRSDEDRRVVKIKMTLKGGHALRRAERAHCEFTDQTLGSLDECELDSLNLILQKLVKSTSKLSPK